MVTRIRRATYNVEEPTRIIGIGRTAAYEGVRSSAIPSIRIGARWLIPRTELERLPAPPPETGGLVAEQRKTRRSSGGQHIPQLGGD